MEPNALVRALDKLLEYAASGIGSVAGPMLAPWKARREAAAREVAAQGEANALRIIAEAQAEARTALVSTASHVRGEIDIAETVRQRIQFQEEKRHRNIGATVGQAAQQLGDKEVPDAEPDHDWTARFFNYIQDISSEEMQFLWGEVLAGEIERPGSTSIRSLSILRNLDQRTASLFRNLCSLSVSLAPDGNQIIDARVPSLGGNAAGNALEPYGLSFNTLNVLNEHGLIISDYNSWRDYRICIGMLGSAGRLTIRVPFGFQGQYWVLKPTNHRNVNSEVRLSGVALTQAGAELSRIVNVSPHAEFTQALGSFFATNNLRMTKVDHWEPQVIAGQDAGK